MCQLYVLVHVYMDVLDLCLFYEVKGEFVGVRLSSILFVFMVNWIAVSLPSELARLELSLASLPAMKPVWSE